MQEVNLVSSSSPTSVAENVKSEAQSIHLEDGTTGFLNQAVKGEFDWEPDICLLTF